MNTSWGYNVHKKSKLLWKEKSLPALKIWKMEALEFKQAIKEKVGFAHTGYLESIF